MYKNINMQMQNMQMLKYANTKSFFKFAEGCESSSTDQLSRVLIWFYQSIHQSILCLVHFRKEFKKLWWNSAKHFLNILGTSVSKLTLLNTTELQHFERSDLPQARSRDRLRGDLWEDLVDDRMVAKTIFFKQLGSKRTNPVELKLRNTTLFLFLS